MKKVQILAVTLLVVLVLLVGMGAVACGGAADETTTPPPGDGAETTTPPPEEEVTGSDGRLRVVVDNIERHIRYLPDEWEGHFGVRPLEPGEGVDLIVIYLTIAPVQDICVPGLEAVMWFLADTDGNECTMTNATYVGGRWLPPTESSCGEEDFWHEVTAEVSFPFPEYATLATLEVVYSFLEPGEGGSIQEGQIDIVLP